MSVDEELETPLDWQRRVFHYLLGRRLGKTETVNSIMDDKRLSRAATAGRISGEGTPKPTKMHFLELQRDVFLSRPGGRGEPKRVTKRLERGTLVGLVWINDDPQDKTPYQIVVDGWRGTYWLSRGHKIIVRDAVVTLTEDDKIVNLTIEPEGELTEQ